MKKYVTIFHAKKTYNKTPISPYNDKTFIFETHTISTNLDLFRVMVSNFILNIPLEKLKSPVRTFRRKVNLEQYYGECIEYFILDIDKVKSKEAKNKILDYFKDYKVILGKSKSYNGIDNFNLKGAIFTECIALEDAKLALSEIHHDLKDLCEIDESVVRKVSLNAPIMKNDVFLNNENGVLYKFDKEKALSHIKNIKDQYLDVLTEKELSNQYKHDLNSIQIVEKEFNSDNVKTIQHLCLKVFNMLGFKAIDTNKDGAISFKHPSEVKSPGGYFWFHNAPYTMHHFNSTRTINIFDKVRKMDIAKELMRKDIDYSNEFLNFNTDTTVVSVNEKYLKVNDEIEDAISNFISAKDGLLSIRSPMGTGKSTLISRLIQECHNEDMKVLIVTNRISVANDFGKKYNIKVYNKDHYVFGDSLVCQYDSLWRYNIKMFDVVIMDEFISLMMHSRSNLSNSSLNVTKFFACFNKKLVIADAFLTGYENFLLSNKKDDIYMIDNVYRDPTTLYNYTNQNYFVQSLLLHSKKHKLTVSATSTSFIESLQMLLSKRGLKVVTLTASTPNSTKELIYDLFEKEDHDKWDVLIYSPTLTVGVSNLNNVDYHFHYDSSMSTDAISSIQMMKRTRKAKEIHMFIKERINYIKTSYDDIRDEYMGNIGKNIEQNYLFDIDDYGEPRLSNIGKKALKIDTFKNILEFNHRKALLWLLKYHFLYEPREINDTFSGDVLMKYKRIINNSNRDLIKNNIEQYLSLNNIEKTSLLMDTESDKVMRTIAFIDNEIKDCDSSIKLKIIEATLENPSFIDNCRKYHAVFNYTKKIWDDNDIKDLVSKSIVNSNKDDLHYYNRLLSYGQNEIFDEYLPRVINSNKKLKYLLDQCGYSITTSKNTKIVGHRSYKVDDKVKELYWHVKI